MRGKSADVRQVLARRGSAVTTDFHEVIGQVQSFNIKFGMQFDENLCLNK